VHDVNKGNAELYILPLYDGVVDAFSFIRRTVLRSENNFSNLVPAPAGFYLK